jgi:hypothetical protein
MDEEPISKKLEELRSTAITVFATKLRSMMVSSVPIRDAGETNALTYCSSLSKTAVRPWRSNTASFAGLIGVVIIGALSNDGLHLKTTFTSIGGALN